MNKPIVFICSPYRPVSKNPIKAIIEKANNIRLAKKACRKAVRFGYVPFAPHLFAPSFLNDKIPKEREIGIDIGTTILKHCDELWIVGPHISEGMKKEIELAEQIGILAIPIPDGVREA